MSYPFSQVNAHGQVRHFRVTFTQLPKKRAHRTVFANRLKEWGAILSETDHINVLVNKTKNVVWLVNIECDPDDYETWQTSEDEVFNGKFFHVRQEVGLYVIQEDKPEIMQCIVVDDAVAGWGVEHLLLAHFESRKQRPLGLKVVFSEKQEEFFRKRKYGDTDERDGKRRLLVRY